MEIQDRVYGTQTITEPVILELIESSPMQRLKGINQAGASQFIKPNRDISRFEHSVGVMILLKLLDAPIEEQIAGLLHDTPHTAFSHVIDFVFKNEAQEFHERFHEKVIINSEIPEILSKHGFQTAAILDESRFPLLERNLPNLCADRIDYTMRDYRAYIGENDRFGSYLSHLVVHNDEIIFDDITVAYWFAKDFILMNEKAWNNPLEIAGYQILADAIRIGFKRGIISEHDIFMDDAHVFRKLTDSDDKTIKKQLSLLNHELRIKEDQENYDFYTKNKLRFVDPKVLEAGGSGVTRVSERFPDFLKRVNDLKKKVEHGNYIKIIP